MRLSALVGKISLVAAVAMAASCGSSANNNGADEDADIGCTMDPRAMAYTPGMQLPGVSNVMTFTLDSSDPGPPLKGSNSWSMRIADSTGAAVTGATVTAVPFMPDHGHGTSVVPVITATSDGYTIDPLYLFMPGLWQVTVEASTPTEQDQVVFYFCIAG